MCVLYTHFDTQRTHTLARTHNVFPSTICFSVDVDPAKPNSCLKDGDNLRCSPGYGAPEIVSFVSPPFFFVDFCSAKKILLTDLREWASSVLFLVLGNGLVCTEYFRMYKNNFVCR
jgi:hypothetical protein